MTDIVKMYFGSTLYGTETPASDKDFKGVFCPSKEQVFLGRVPKSIPSNTKKDNGAKNTADDVDTEMYSLHYFLKLACEGETVALDMLHAPQSMLICDSPTWQRIVSERQRFYTRNLKAFVGYARRQAAKYGVKGSRLNAAKQVWEYLMRYAPDQRMEEIWLDLPIGEYLHKLPNGVTGEEEYEVCGRRIQRTTHIKHALPIVENFWKNYGARAEQAARNEGIDFKACSHALRAAYQVKSILTLGTIVFPLPEADYLRTVKQGKLHYQREVAPELERVMDEVEALSAASTLPESVDRAYWDRFIVEELERRFT